ncbi:hypothetical protein BDV32DRAFT_141056 [Aspergillus pseudonomiae]|uniref:ER-bound oxygenase mpaB/mpaB'/Rubber oxygenase catalytic domain-containing protein n=1 Tax=Aspergillus pseudonomiae TaxID=1506151 RepID=A0A5N7DGD3_9EURO|nr:uncharacterized protein BDV37DRAFT_293171 [Aspergillus pseudonomiae]KAB8256614.1 hypothetical protein BDV32DRAFT_141056 [Aspergillus pseudonomiae]KAE8405481.1 hypothetical protein BDV37DRAFT_293171 [Aspergillus pseudonomiae]
MAEQRSTNAKIYKCWGYTFEWIDGLHSPVEQLHSIMLNYDKLVDECLDRLDEISPPGSARAKSTGSPDARTPKRDLYSLLEKHAKDDPKLDELWSEVNTVPDWVEWEQIKRGQEVFFRYGTPILNVLGFQSLLGGMGSPRVVETLARTGGFSADVVRRRLLETLQHILQVSLSLDSIKPGGKGHISSVRVRLLHGSVRRRVLSLVKYRPEYYDIKKYGIPINDLDCIGTIHTFSTSVVFLGLPRQGIFLRNQEIDDYIALWRLVAYYMGTPTECFETTARARAMMESISVSELDPTDTGRILAQNIIIGLENTAPTYASKEYLEAMARKLNGDELSDRLDLPRPSLYYQALVYGHCIMVMATCYGLRVFPMLDQAFIKSHNAFRETQGVPTGMVRCRDSGTARSSHCAPCWSGPVLRGYLWIQGAGPHCCSSYIHPRGLLKETVRPMFCQGEFTVSTVSVLVS